MVDHARYRVLIWWNTSMNDLVSVGKVSDKPATIKSGVLPSGVVNVN